MAGGSCSTAPSSLLRAAARERPGRRRAGRRRGCCGGSAAIPDAPRRSFELEPPIDVPDLPGDVARFVTAKEGDDVRDLAGRARAPEENTPLDLFRDKGADLLAHLCLDDPWSDGVDADAAGRELDGERPRERLERAFGRRVVALAATGALCCHRRDIDDRAAAPREHVPRHLAADVHGAEQVYPQHVLEIAGLARAEERVAHDAGDADENVRRSEAGGEFLDHALHVADGRDVAGQEHGAPWEGFDLTRQCAGGIPGTEVADADGHAAPGERQRSRAADSSRGSRDQRNSHATSTRTALARPGAAVESSSALRPGAPAGDATRDSGPGAARLRPAIGGMERRRSSSIHAAACATAAAAPSLPNAAAVAVRRAPESTRVETSRRSSSSCARRAHAAPSTTRSPREIREAIAATAAARGSPEGSGARSTPVATSMRPASPGSSPDRASTTATAASPGTAPLASSSYAGQSASSPHSAAMPRAPRSTSASGASSES